MEALIASEFVDLFNLYLGEHVDWQVDEELRNGAKGLAEAIKTNSLNTQKILLELKAMLRNWSDSDIEEFSAHGVEVDWFFDPEMKNALRTALQKLLEKLESA